MIPTQAIESALALVQHGSAVDARVMLVAIGLQESGFTVRKQYGNGPARGFWQFEKGGGVHGVLTHPTTRPYALKTCHRLGVSTSPLAVWTALETNDELGAIFARLLLLSDPELLPEIGDEDGAWELYLRTWRPGKPHRERWAENYPLAVAEAIG